MKRDVFSRSIARLTVALLAASPCAAQEPPQGVSRDNLRAGDEYRGVELDAPASGAIKHGLPVSIRVYEDNVIRPVDRDLLGFNHNWFWSWVFVEKGSTRPHPGLIEAAEGLPMPLNRMAGTGSQYMQWKLAVGPLDQRTPQRTRAHKSDPEKVVNAGPLEWVKTVRAIDPDAEFVWVLNMNKDRPEDHADLVEMFTGDGTTNPNGGKNWAQFRIDQGVERPVSVKIWELGNELDWGKERKHFHPVEKYIAACKEAIAAVRSVDPNARFAAHAATAPWGKQARQSGDWPNWHRAVLEELGDDIDYLAFHPYYHGLSTAAIGQYTQTLVDDIRSITGSDRIKLFHSEHGRWPPRPKDGTPWSKNHFMTHSLEGCLATGEFLNVSLSDPNVGAMTYHVFNGGPWKVVQRSNGEYSTTGIADLFKVFNQGLGDEIVDVRLRGEGVDLASKELTFTATASRDADGLKLILVNRSTKSARPTRFVFDRPYRLVKRIHMTGPHKDAVNSRTRREITVEETEIESDRAFTTLTVPAMSIVVLHLEPTARGQ